MTARLLVVVVVVVVDGVFVVGGAEGRERKAGEKKRGRKWDDQGTDADWACQDAR